MKVLAVIPARRGSTRLSEKPLREIGGKTLVERVWLQASQCKDIDDLYVATDDQEIFDLSESFGAKVLMTSPELPSGSARVAAVSHVLNDQWEIIANVQGDMPFINPKVISQVIRFFKDNFTKFSMATIAIPIYDEEEFRRNSVVKVVISSESRALYFSRAPIPNSRDGDEWKIAQSLS
jgi:3-deoxy-manno-octulosonate cytidylyltransferase (CMP-KDO synthetase)